ncbi:MAG TPA: Ig-like domain-containing protein [Thermoanaerobaculia bacterium]|nr:Ig-like domain-containing protein [Thermoanaerobaculia bacterium]
MWRWVTRCLVLAFLALLAPVLLAQLTFHGEVEAPDPGKVHSGIVLVKGWAFDPLAISKIELWVDDQYQHDALLHLPRVDVVEAYPDWPGIHTARPGFVTGFRADRFPNGPHTVEMRIYTSDGQMHFLGRRTININNSVNQAPFGFLDIPDGAGVKNVSGAFPVSGWAADLDGLTKIEVLVDGGVVQGAIYGDPRPDVGGTFPDFNGALYSGYVANIDSTRIENGVHTLTVRATDRKGMTSTIGHRTVQVINNDNFLRPFGYLDQPQRDARLYGTGCGGTDPEPPVISPPINPENHLTPIRGWALDLGTRSDTGRVAYAELLIDGVTWLTTDDCGIILDRYANCYGLPRYDVARYYPTFPDALFSGFLFTLDVGALLNLGVRPGVHRLMVKVGDQQGTFAELPNRDGIPVFFQCVDDAFDFAGYGFIEYPNAFDFIGGTVMFRGWALDDQESVVSVEIIVDGNFVGHAQYGYPRPDVAEQYPFIFGANRSGWIFEFDTRKLTNGRHRVTARTVDASGDRTEIGSVDFFVANNNPQP